VKLPQGGGQRSGESASAAGRLTRYDQGPGMDLPTDDSIRRIVKAFAHLRAAHGAAIGSPALLQPTSAYFPDEFRPDGRSVAQLLKRMMGYAPLSSELGIELALSMPEPSQAGGCGGAACSSGGGGGPAGVDVHELDEGYRVVVAAPDVGNPDLLSASLARSVGALVLHEAGEPVGAETSEIAAVVCGFGVLLLNGSAVWAKSCGGLRMAQATVLPVEELAVALALFAGVHGHKVSVVRRHLGTTQREALDVADDWVESNPFLMESLRDRPARLESGVLDLEPVRGVFGQWLHKRKLERAMRLRPTKESSVITDARRRRLEEVAALLDEAGEGDPG
jgi:hypothetical protein